MTKRRRRRRKGLLVRVVAGVVLVAAVGGLVAVLVGHESGLGLGRPLPRASLLYTCDLQGKLAPCTCEEGSLGGVARLASLFETWSKEHADSLIVDVGNATIVDHEAAEAINRLTFEALDQVGCVVVNCGVNEAAMPRDQLVAVAGTSTFKLISANILDVGSGNPVLPPYHIVTRSGARVAFVGLVRSDIKEGRVGKGLRVIEPEDALRDALTSLEGKADVVVVLAYLPPERLYELARTYAKVRIFLGGDAQASSAPYELVRTIVTTKAGTAGAGGKAGTARPEVQDVLVAYLGDQGLTAGQLEAVFPRNRFPLVNAQIRRVGDDLPDAPSMSDVLARFTKAVAADKRPGATWDPTLPGTTSIISAEVCRLCHTSEFYGWQDTKHAGAYVTLLQEDAADARQGTERPRKRHEDHECLQCHTTGYGMPNGYLERLRAAETAQAAVAKLDLHMTLRDLDQRLSVISDEAEKARLTKDKAKAQKALDELADVDLAKLRVPEENLLLLKKLELEAALRALDAPGASRAQDTEKRKQELVSALRELQHVDLNRLGQAEKDAVAKHARDRLKLVDALKNVGCETCHGGALRHVGIARKERALAGKTPFQRQKVSARDCIRCHRTERPCLSADTADPFDLEAYLDRIKHWR